MINRGKTPARVKEVTLFDLKLDLPPTTTLYGEGFQMLSQTGGEAGRPVDLGNYTDAKHYKMPQPEGARVFYGLMTTAPPEGDNLLLAFASCRRFAGQFYLRPNSLQVVVDTEGLELKPGESWENDGMLLSGDDLTKIAPDRLAMLKKLLPPTGRAAEFADDSLRVGVVNLPGARMVCVFNWEDQPQTISVPLPRSSRVTDFWSGEDLGRREGSLEIKDLPPRSARLLVCK